MEHLEQRFAGHPTFKQIAKTLQATREPGPALSRALYLLKKAQEAADAVPRRE